MSEIVGVKVAGSNVIGVSGNKYFMPPEFPISFPENAGNMVHAQAPLDIFPGAIHSGDPKKPWGMCSFNDWVNRESTHLVFLLANTIRLDSKKGTAGDRSFIAKIQSVLEETPDTELVIFGLGAQAPSTNLEDVEASVEAVNLMKYLGERCKVVGVRGEFTKKVFKHFAGVTNTFVTGCPSMFSRPSAVRTLHEMIRERKMGRAAFSGTSYRRPGERKMLIKAIKNKEFLIEPQNRANHQFYLESLLENRVPEVPDFLQSAIQNGEFSTADLSEYFSRYYRLFRSRQAWDDFNREFVSFTYGTRFHVNMASVLSGVPALWLTHDSRTSEMVDFLHLPSLSLTEAEGMSSEEIRAAVNYDDFFENIPRLFKNFNEYLSHFGLEGLKLTF